MRLENRVAVVTGGGSGIGREICRALAREGASVAVTDLRDEAAEAVAAQIQDASRGQAAAWAFDVGDRPAVEQAAAEIEKQLGPLDIWVNNAGWSKIVPFLDCTDDMWDRSLHINLTGTFIGCQVAIRSMLPRRR